MVYWSIFEYMCALLCVSGVSVYVCYIGLYLSYLMCLLCWSMSECVSELLCDWCDKTVCYIDLCVNVWLCYSVSLVSYIAVFYWSMSECRYGLLCVLSAIYVCYIGLNICLSYCT